MWPWPFLSRQCELVGFDDLFSRADHATRHLDMTPPATSATVARAGAVSLGHPQFKNRPRLPEPFSGWRIILPRAGIFQGWGDTDRPPPKSPVGRLNWSGLSATCPALGPFL